jgi:hypothetical protein
MSGLAQQKNAKTMKKIFKKNFFLTFSQYETGTTGIFLGLKDGKSLFSNCGCYITIEIN